MLYCPPSLAMTQTSRKKTDHEFRDPIHGFIHMSSDELQVVNSPPFQRLRHIRQLSLSHLVYPGATHTRFEHSLGVMELAGRVFDTVTKEDNLHDKVGKQHADDLTHDRKVYWRRHLRLAALCHDLGHLPFSHAGERLLPDGWERHDSVSIALVKKSMNEAWGKMRGVDVDIVAQIAVGLRPKIWRPLGGVPTGDSDGGPWAQVMSAVITDDAFGVDRMDYLLRDAYYTGVTNGVFDYRQLIEALRILPKVSDSGAESGELSLGLTRGGVLTAEAMAVARYLMYQQVYYHRTRKIYDRHLQQFLGQWLPGGKFSADPEKFLGLTDVQIWGAIMDAAKDPDADGHVPARRIIKREHFKLVYEHWPQAASFADLVSEARKKFDKRFKQEEIVIEPPDPGGEQAEMPNFPVWFSDGQLQPSGRVSEVLRAQSEDAPSDISNAQKRILRPSYGYVFADGAIADEVRKWFTKKTSRKGENNEHD